MKKKQKKKKKKRKRKRKKKKKKKQVTAANIFTDKSEEKEQMNTKQKTNLIYIKKQNK